MFTQGCSREVKVRFRHLWRFLAAILIPIILSPMTWAFASHVEETTSGSSSLDPNLKYRTAYVILIMAIFWIFEVIPLAITSLFPLVLFPFLGVRHASTISQTYMKESNMIFLGGIILALAIEYSNLHIRGALAVIRIFGANPAKITLAILFITAFLSMWISDTSCCTMFIPIVSALTTAMFREEHDEIAEDAPKEEAHFTGDPLTTGRRRQSIVFANSALQGSRIQRKRSSRKLSTFSHTKTTISPHSLSGSGSTTNSSNSSSQDSRSISDSGFSVERASSTSISGETSNHSVYATNELPPVSSSPSLKRVRLHSLDNIQEGVVAGAVTFDKRGEAQGSEQEHGHHDTEQGERKGSDRCDCVELQSNIRKMLLFAVAYGTSIGGTGSLIGTGPIKVFKELVKNYKLEKNENLVGITFFTWMSCNVPPLIVNVLIAWLFLVSRYLGFRGLRARNEFLKDRKKMQEYLDEEYEKLGPISAHQIGVLVVFILVVSLWLLRDPQLFNGWDAIDPSTDNGDSTVAMFGVILLFIIPKDWSFVRCGGKYSPSQTPGKYEALLDWKFVSTNAPWGYILLIGSGYAIADASDASGLSAYIGDGLIHLKYLPKHVLLIIVIAFTSLFTEFASNTACANLLLPVLFSLSCRLEIHPIYLTMASAVAASYAFMLPISSPPNAIIFATGELHIHEMLWNGLFLNIMCVLVLYTSMLTYAEVIFKFSHFEAIAHKVHPTNCILGPDIKYR